MSCDMAFIIFEIAACIVASLISGLLVFLDIRRHG